MMDAASTPRTDGDIRIAVTARPVKNSTITTMSWLRLRATAFAPRIARKLVYELGEPPRLPEGVVDDAAFVVGELVAESIRHKHHDFDFDFDVVVEVDGEQITVRVRDASGSAAAIMVDSGRTPARRSATVRQLAASWGCHRYQQDWEVWAVLRPRPTALADAM